MRPDSLMSKSSCFCENLAFCTRIFKFFRVLEVIFENYKKRCLNIICHVQGFEISLKAMCTRQSRICTVTIFIPNLEIQQNQSLQEKRLHLRDSVHRLPSFLYALRSEKGLAHQDLVKSALHVRTTDLASEYAITAIEPDTVVTIATRKNVVKTISHFEESMVMTWLYVCHERDLIERHSQKTSKGM